MRTGNYADVAANAVRMGIAFGLGFIAFAVLSPWLAEETRPTFDERPESERFCPLR